MISPLFVTEEDYQPIIVNGKNEIWFENLMPYRISELILIIFIMKSN